MKKRYQPLVYNGFAMLIFLISMQTSWAQCSVGNPQGALDYANCNGVGGWAFDRANLNQTITVDIYIDGVKTYSGIQANGDRQDLVAAFGSTAARYHGFSFSFPANAPWKNGQNHSVSVRICGVASELGASPKTVNGCSGGSQPSTPSSGCAYTEGQFLFTTSWGESVYAHYYNGALYAGYKDGSNFKPQHWLTATGMMTSSTASCFAENDPHTSTTTPPTTNPPQNSNCTYTEGQYLFTFNTERMYAHYYNGVLYAAYQDGSNFRPQHWLTATGLMSNSTASCFAENNPHNSTTTPPTTTNPTTPSTLPPAPSNLAGNMDWADCNSISGWVLNKNTPNQSTKVDVYINGHLAASNVLAVVSRQDVANAFGISGFNAFVFNYIFPGKYKTGVPLTIGVRYAGTRTHIPGSPKTTQTCPNSGLGGFPSCGNQVAGRTGYVDTESTPKGRSGISSLQLRASRSGQPGSITSKLVPVRQGNELSVTAFAYAPTVTKRNLTPQLATAVAGGIVAGITLANQPAGATDHPLSKSRQTVPMLGLSTVLAIPLVKFLVADRLPKAGMELAFYDKRGNFVRRQSVHISKAVGQDWELLILKGDALQDGFVALRLENASKNPVWFDQVSLERTSHRLSESVAVGHFSPQPSLSSNGFARSIVPSDLTIAGTENCAGVGGGGGSPTPSDDNTLPEVTVTASHWEDIDVQHWGGDDWSLDTPTFPEISDIGTPVSDADNNNSGAGEQTNEPSKADSINSSQLKPCMKIVLYSLLSGSQISDIIKKFSGTEKDYNWILKDGRLGANSNAETKSYDRVNRSVTTTFDTNKFADATDLSIARTILHESVHAYLVTYFASDPLMANADYPDMVVAWMGVKRPDLNQIHHDEMVQSFISDIASELKFYGESKGYVISDDYYFKLAWGGLENTNAFKSQSSITQAATKDVIRIELTGNKTDGSPFTQVGTKTGCP
ncbi:hypothetical protein [Spirosoma aerolatum]|uniref:hypothetical protein n=1 Tax=Spirosoma aerolatum TaxID=1211326 RepID=UPI0012D36E82|nr:hypothetical protein [Spirosoma aerolatum]